MPRSVFLTSSPCSYPPPPGVDAPFVLSEENGFLRLLHKVLPEDTRLLLIAADPDDADFNERLLADFTLGFRASGFPGLQADILQRTNQDKLQPLLDRSDLVLLCGGHVPTQNRFFRQINLQAALSSYARSVMGISAGSMNAAETVYAQPELPGESTDKGYARFLPGLGLTRVQILPHLNKERHTILHGKRLYEDITFPDSIGRCFLAIPDGSFVFVQDGQARLHGEGWKIAEGVMTKVAPKESVLALSPEN